MTNEDLTIYHKGESHSVLNIRLIEKQGLTAKDVVVIKELHEEKLATLDLMNLAEGSNLKSLAKIVTEIEFQLQDAWKFKRDANYHRFWTVPQCACPKWDNEERLGTGYFVTNLSCKVHGECNV